MGLKVFAPYTNKRINVSGLSSGIYLIRFNNEDSQTLKFVKP